MQKSLFTILSVLVSFWILMPFAPAQTAGEDGVLRILFIHHSVGSNWLGDGLDDALEDPNLNDFGFEMHDATYGDTIGDDTDVCHWYPKFLNQLDLVLTFDYSPDHYYTDPKTFNKIVMFKSCYPASDIEELGAPPGDPVSEDKTIWNYKAAYLACATIFAKQPQVLFVAVTAPPRNRNSSAYSKERGLNAWSFNTWLRGEYVEQYRYYSGFNNLVVFDWFGDLLAEPKNDPLYPGALKEIYSSGGTDSHPNDLAGHDATNLFLPFLNQAVHSWLSFRGSKGTFRVGGPDSVYFALHAPPHAGRPYIVLGSMSGVCPGTNMGEGVVLPLNWDLWTDLTVTYGNCGFMPGFRGKLDSNGEALAAFHTNTTLPTALLWSSMYYAYLVYSPFQFASGVVRLVFVP